MLRHIPINLYVQGVWFEHDSYDSTTTMLIKESRQPCLKILRNADIDHAIIWHVQKPDLDEESILNKKKNERQIIEIEMYVVPNMNKS